MIKANVTVLEYEFYTVELLMVTGLQIPDLIVPNPTSHIDLHILTECDCASSHSIYTFSVVDRDLLVA